jgi:outer membrane protein insertion porin family
MNKLLFLLAACGNAPQHVDTPLPPVNGSAAPVVATKVAVSELDGNIKTITVKSDDQTQAQSLKSLLAPEVGKPLNRARLRDELDQVFGTKGIADITVDAVQLDDGIELVLAIKPQPALHSLTAHEAGGADLPLPGQLATATGLPLDPLLLDAVVTQLREDYLAKGYTDVSATWAQTTLPTHQVDVAIEVNPGKATTVTSVAMKGNKKLKQADLVKAVAVPVNAPYSAEVMDRAVLVLTTYYYDHGFINVQVSPPAPSGGAGAATFTIIEGDQYRIGKLDITGVTPAEAKKYLAMLKLKKGDVFSRASITNGLEKIQADAKRAVEPITKLDPDKHTIDIELQLPKSP